MRLGDLDALKKAIDDYAEKRQDTLLWQADIEELIDNAPTVEVTKIQSYTMGFSDGLKAQTYQKPPMFERPQGEWIELREYDYKCSLCGNTMMDKWEYCPSCGAKMEE